MADVTDTKAMLRGYLQDNRDALLWKLDGLGERELRMPRTPTGTNLLGMVVHCANVEIGYFGPTFGRSWPEPEDPCFVAEEAFDDDPQADWWIPAEVPAAAVVDFYRRVQAFADDTVEAMPLDAPGRVPWWRPGRQEVTLQRIIVHVADDLARHAGQADILREQHDGSVGLVAGRDNMPDGVDWPTYVERLTRLAEQFPAG